MPKFETVSVAELKVQSGMSEARKKRIEQYISYIKQLSPEIGGKLTCLPNENVTTVRNDLKKAAELAGVNITTRRSGDVITVMMGKSRRGRRKKAST